jgi:cyclophilin family peptidyl-prolyl cis-trans isomerase
MAEQLKRRGLRSFPTLLVPAWVAVALLAAGPLGAVTVTVKDSAVNMRAGPGLEHPVVDKLAQGEVLEVLGRSGKWFLVSRYGLEGWVFATLVTEPTGEVPRVPPPEPAARPEEPPPAPPAEEPAAGETSADLPLAARDNILRTSKGDLVVEAYRPGRDYVAVIETDLGAFVVELWVGTAPNHVKNFIRLGTSGYYEGLSIHRVVPRFLIQGGDPRGDGTGGPGYTIALEPGGRSHGTGVLSMSRRARDVDSAGSQFFVTLEAQPVLDGQYSAFGAVVEGMEVVRGIGRLPTDDWDRPIEPVRIQRVRILERGDWEAPK